MHSLTQTPTHLTHSTTHPAPTHSYTYPLTHLLGHTLTYTHTHTHTHSLNHPQMDFTFTHLKLHVATYCTICKLHQHWRFYFFFSCFKLGVWWYNNYLSVLIKRDIQVQIISCDQKERRLPATLDQSWFVLVCWTRSSKHGTTGLNS